MNEQTGAGVRWRVPPQQVAVKWLACAAFVALAALSSGDPQRMLLAGAAAVGAGALALRDVLAPVRVAADAEGVTLVTGYATRRRVPWGEVTAVRVDERRRLLTTTRLLEIETGGTADGTEDDHDVYLFSRFDLGVDVADAAAGLERLREAAR
ncbi:PH domain-containing protein [Actinomadura kijaniata]|uniref:PH domain-containing protein n=1 Tax=Actinomadura kijaniata TaxID=46161 RepID=UPI000A961B67|nr:PH domain-containing protein [Actinomadura kijaniata]